MRKCVAWLCFGFVISAAACGGDGWFGESAEKPAEPMFPARTEEPIVPLASLRLGETPFEIARPSVWEEGPFSGETVLESWIDPRVEWYPNLNVTLESAPAPGEEGVEKLYEELAASLPGFETKEAAWQTVNGVTGLRSIASWPSILGDLTALRMMIPWEGKVIVVSFVDLTENFENNVPVYSECLDALAPFEPVVLDSQQ